MARNEPVRMYVDPNFRRIIKKRAADSDTSITNITRQLARDIDFDIIGKKNDKKRFSFKFM